MDIVSNVLQKGHNPKGKSETVKLIADRKQLNTIINLCIQKVNKYFIGINSSFPVRQLK